MTSSACCGVRGASEETERAAHLGKGKWREVGSMLEEEVSGGVEVVPEVLEGLFHPGIAGVVVPGAFDIGFDLLEFGTDEEVAPISIGDRVDLIVVDVVDHEVLVSDTEPVTIIPVREKAPEVGMWVTFLRDEGSSQEGVDGLLGEGGEVGPDASGGGGEPILDIGSVGVDVVALSFDGFHV